MEDNGQKMPGTNDEAEAGAAVYSRLVLSVYDLYVIAFSNSLAWRCPAQRILDLYNTQVSARHLDVGVGTGYFLDRCRFPSESPLIALADLNPNSLTVTARRLRRYHPLTYRANVLEPLSIDLTDFDSVGLNFLLHCLPGNMLSKGRVFRNIRPLLSDNAVVFGTTILGKGVEHNLLGRALLRVYNRKGIFSNLEDSREALEAVLKKNFRSCDIWVEGCVAFFVARV